MQRSHLAWALPVLGRVGYSLVVLALVLTVAFVSLRLAPGDVTTQILDPIRATPESVAALRDSLGLDQPIYQQFLRYLGDLFRGDLGVSLVTGERVTAIVANAGAATLLLAGTALLFTYAVAVPMGITAARHNGRWLDRGISTLSGILLATPNFALAVLVVWVISLQLGWLPVAGSGTWRHLVLPAVVLAAEPIGFTTRMVRTSYLEQASASYVDSLRARGIPERAIRLRHILRNSLLPLISLGAVQARNVVGYTLIVEIVFRWPGLGRRLVESILSRDYTVAQSLTLLLALIVVLSTVLSEVLYRRADPRMRKL